MMHDSWLWSKDCLSLYDCFGLKWEMKSEYDEKFIDKHDRTIVRNRYYNDGTVFFRMHDNLNKSVRYIVPFHELAHYLICKVYTPELINELDFGFKNNLETIYNVENSRKNNGFTLYELEVITCVLDATLRAYIDVVNWKNGKPIENLFSSDAIKSINFLERSVCYLYAECPELYELVGQKLNELNNYLINFDPDKIRKLQYPWYEYQIDELHSTFFGFSSIEEREKY